MHFLLQCTCVRLLTSGPLCQSHQCMYVCITWNFAAKCAPIFKCLGNIHICSEETCMSDGKHTITVTELQSTLVHVSVCVRVCACVAMEYVLRSVCVKINGRICALCLL